jgi:hypothetical protein
MKKLLNLIPESIIRTSGNQKDFKKLNIFQYPAKPLWNRLSEDNNNFSTRFKHKCIYKILNNWGIWGTSINSEVLSLGIKSWDFWGRCWLCWMTYLFTAHSPSQRYTLLPTELRMGDAFGLSIFYWLLTIQFHLKERPSKIFRTYGADGVNREHREKDKTSLRQKKCHSALNKTLSSMIHTCEWWVRHVFW